MNRGISSVLDVGIAMVLIGASVAVVAGVPPDDAGVRAGSPVADVGGTAIGGSTLTVRYERPDGPDAVVTGTVVGLMRDAALAPRTAASEAYTRSVERAVAERIERTGAHVQIVGACPGAGAAVEPFEATGPVVAGSRPPDDRPVDATVYRWKATPGADGRACEPVVVIRRWSP